MRLHAPLSAPLPALAAAELQHDLLAAAHELDRLQVLLADACVELMRGFHDTAHGLRELQGDDADASGRVLHRLGSAITALQFHDIASQLIDHTNQRLRGCVERIGLEGSGDGHRDAATPAAARAHPVAQHAMRAGSVELF